MPEHCHYIELAISKTLFSPSPLCLKITAAVQHFISPLILIKTPDQKKKMENSTKNQTDPTQEEEKEQTATQLLVTEEEVEELKKCLPKVTSMGNNIQLVKYEGFWLPELFFRNIISFQRHFQARDSDLIIASYPKTGNTWLKALLFAIVNRATKPINQSPLLKKHPHELVCCLENDIFGNAFEYPQPHHLDELPSPRLFHTHLSFGSLPNSIKTSKCRILYLTRNPLDAFVSHLHFVISALKNMKGGDDQFQLPSVESYFEDCYQGKIPYGPFLDHVVGYWRQSLEQPNKVLFLKYEDMKNDPIVQLKRLAEFVGFPFSPNEEREGVIQDIVQLCSFKNMKELQVNNDGVINKFFDKKSYFRKGEVGDGGHYFTPQMVENFHKLMDEKLDGTGLSFEV